MAFVTSLFLGNTMKTSIIPVFIPHIGCPYRCVFCNQWKITGRQGLPTSADVAAQIKAYITENTRDRHWEVAFYGGSFTAIPVAIQEALLTPAKRALEEGTIQGIRCSTRPDCIDETVLQRLLAFGVDTVELGVQSLDDYVLRLAKRGHTANDVERATTKLKAWGIRVGHQFMPGLPGETVASLQYTVAQACALHCDFARIYPVVVIAGTELAISYQKGTYTPLSIAEGIRRGAYMKQKLLQARIPVIRTGLQATDALSDTTQVLGGAYTPAMGELIDTYRYRRQLMAVLARLPQGEKITISYHRTDTSRVRGYRNLTVKFCQWRYALDIEWHEREDLPPTCVSVQTSKREYMLYMDAGSI